MTASDNKSADRIRGERRDDRRYNLGLDLRWKLVRRRKVLDSGSGRTLDLSSSGLCFEAGRALPVGLNVEISISWPALLHDIAPMQLVVSGKIVRAEGGRAAVRMVQHEFRTTGNPVSEQRPAGARGASLPFSGSLPAKARALP